MEVRGGRPWWVFLGKNGPAASRKALPWGSQKRTLKSWSDVKLPHNPNQVGSKPENSNTSDLQSFFSFPVWISVQSPCQNTLLTWRGGVYVRLSVTTIPNGYILGPFLVLICQFPRPCWDIPSLLSSCSVPLTTSSHWEAIKTGVSHRETKACRWPLQNS